MLLKTYLLVLVAFVAEEQRLCVVPTLVTVKKKTPVPGWNQEYNAINCCKTINGKVLHLNLTLHRGMSINATA